MLWGAGLEGSPWQVRRNAMPRPAGDSPVTSAPPASPGLDLGPFTVMHEANVVRNLPGHDSVNAPDAQHGCWVLSLVTGSLRGVTSHLFCPVGSGSLKSTPSLSCGV